MRANDELTDPTKHARELAQRYLDKLERYADVLLPKDADEPILHPMVRIALADWLWEVRQATALKSVKCKPRSRIMLSGPPGCGKTTFAHHFAARLGVPLALIRSESLQSRYVNQSAEQIGEMFDILEKLGRNVVIFLDEFDSLGAKRDGNASREDAKSLNVILRRIEKTDGILLAATNRPDIIDPALWRRFDGHIEIALPGDEERFAIIKRYAEPFTPSDDDLHLLAELTRHASPSLLRNLMEGMKRTLVLGKARNLKLDTPLDVFARVVATVVPPLDAQNVPPLWKDPERIHELSRVTWPMARAA